MSKIRVGIFGAARGREHYSNCQLIDDYQIVAICDRDKKMLSRAEGELKDYPTEIKYYEDVNEFFECPMDAVILVNYFNEHAPYAIKALKKGIHVFSECTSASTLKECVELCEAVEESNCIYMLGENYPYSSANMEMRKLYQEGALGHAIYGQGEYNHNETVDVLREITPNPYHWRAWLPRTYYCTHALGPLMYATDAMPKKINGRAVHSEKLKEMDDFRHNYDALGLMQAVMDDGSMFQFTGCAAIPSGSRYRLIGERGSIETNGASFCHTQYYGWDVPEGKEPYSDYDAPWPFDAEKANHGGHAGGDYWTLYYFAKAIRENKQPFFDVYRGVAMSACGILGWRSCLNDGATYEIPDFKNKEEREKYRNDDATPFVNEMGEGGTVPPSVGRASHMEDVANGNDEVYKMRDKLLQPIVGEKIFDFMFTDYMNHYEKLGGSYDEFYTSHNRICIKSDGIIAYTFKAPVTGKYNFVYYYGPANEPNRGFGFAIDNKEDIKDYFGNYVLATMGAPRVVIPVELTAGEHKILCTGPKGYDNVRIKGVDTNGFGLYLVEETK